MGKLAVASGRVASNGVLAALLTCFLTWPLRLRLLAIASNAAGTSYANHLALPPIKLWRLWAVAKFEGASKAAPRGGLALAALMLAVLLAPGPAVGGEAPALPFARIRFLEAGRLGGTLLLPAHQPVAGLVVLLPDGQGADPRSASYVEQLLGGGFAVFDVLQGADDPSAIALAIAELPAAAQLEVVPIGVLGFGTGARQALALRHGVAGRVLLYPGCAGSAVVAATDPVLLLHGEGDESNTVGACADLAARLAHDGRLVRRIGYAGAGYAWDYPVHGEARRLLLPRPDGGGSVAALPWPQLADLSASQVAAFFATHLRKRAP